MRQLLRQQWSKRGLFDPLYRCQNHLTCAFEKIIDMTPNLIRLLGIAALILLQAACSSTPSGEKIDYKRQTQAEQNLEIPPDLTSDSITDTMKVPDIMPESTTTYSDYEGDQQKTGNITVATEVLPSIDNIVVHRDGNQRWLEITASPEEVWPKVVAFWRDNGLLLVEQNPTVGIMKTDWLENRADIKQGFLTEFLRKAMDGIYATATRDQFRIRLEPGEAGGVTNLFLIHRGMEEKLVGGTQGDDRTLWVSRPNDPELEAEMLRRLMVFLGVDDAKAEQQLAAKPVQEPRSRLIKSEQKVELLINEGFSRAWRLTGVALDRVGFVVEDRDRANGIYFVRYDDPDKETDQGWLSGLFKEKIDTVNQYQVRLIAQGDQALLQVFNQQKQRDNSSTATRILTLIHEQIR